MTDEHKNFATAHAAKLIQADDNTITFAFTKQQLLEVIALCTTALAEDDPYDRHGFHIAIRNEETKNCRAPSPCGGGEVRLSLVRPGKRSKKVDPDMNGEHPNDTGDCGNDGTPIYSRPTPPTRPDPTSSDPPRPDPPRKVEFFLHRYELFALERTAEVHAMTISRFVQVLVRNELGRCKIRLP